MAEAAKKTGEVHPGITQQMVDDAKSKHKEKNIRYAELQDENGDVVLTVLVRRPDRVTKGEFSKWVEKNPNKAEDILLKACLLSHKEEVCADEELMESAMDAINKMLVTRSARVKNV